MLKVEFINLGLSLMVWGELRFLNSRMVDRKLWYFIKYEVFILGVEWCKEEKLRDFFFDRDGKFR